MHVSVEKLVMFALNNMSCNCWNSQEELHKHIWTFVAESRNKGENQGYKKFEEILIVSLRYNKDSFFSLCELDGSFSGVLIIVVGISHWCH